jgi:hypothetical protein
LSPTCPKRSQFLHDLYIYIIFHSNKINWTQIQNKIRTHRNSQGRFGCFVKWGYPQIIHFNRIFHYKLSIVGYLHFRKPPFPAVSVSVSGHRYPEDLRGSAAAPQSWDSWSPRGSARLVMGETLEKTHGYVWKWGYTPNEIAI